MNKYVKRSLQIGIPLALAAWIIIPRIDGTRNEPLRYEIESDTGEEFEDLNWCGNFPEPLDLLGKDFPKTADLLSDG